jgi:hypothetical protein
MLHAHITALEGDKRLETGSRSIGSSRRDMHAMNDVERDFECPATMQEMEEETSGLTKSDIQASGKRRTNFRIDNLTRKNNSRLSHQTTSPPPNNKPSA